MVSGPTYTFLAHERNCVPTKIIVWSLIFGDDANSVSHFAISFLFSRNEKCTMESIRLSTVHATSPTIGRLS